MEPTRNPRPPIRAALLAILLLILVSPLLLLVWLLTGALALAWPPLVAGVATARRLATSR